MTLPFSQRVTSSFTKWWKVCLYKHSKEVGLTIIEAKTKLMINSTEEEVMINVTAIEHYYCSSQVRY